MPVYDYGFVKSDRPLTAAELARAQAQLGMGSTLDDLKEYYRQRYGRGGALAGAGERVARPIPLPLPAGQPIPQPRPLPVTTGEPMPRMQPLTTAGAVRQTALPAPVQVSPVISPAFQGTLTSLEEHWRRTMPTYMPYAPGTPTFAREKWEKETALSEQEKKLALALERTATFGKVATKEDAGLLGVSVGTPTWEAFNAAAERAHELRLANIRAAGGGGTELSATEAKNLTRGTYANMIKKEIDAEWKEGGWAQAKDALADIEARIWKDAGEMMRAGLTYNDIISLINYARSLVGGVPAYSASGGYVEEP